MRVRLSPVSVTRTNSVAGLARYAAPVHRWFAILVTLSACKDHEVERLTAIKAEVCACKSTTCAEQAIQRVPQAPIKSTHRAQALARDMLDCLAKLQAAERPTTDPDAEDSAAAPPPAVPPPAVAPLAVPPPVTAH